MAASIGAIWSTKAAIASDSPDNICAALPDISLFPFPSSRSQT